MIIQRALSFVSTTARTCLKMVPGARQLLYSTQGQALRNSMAQMFEERQGFTFTQFLRLPTQFQALIGPVLEQLGAREAQDAIRIIVVGGSSGAEPYSISSVLLQHWPKLAVTIDSFDIDEDVIAIARCAKYSASDVFNNPLITPEFIEQTFDRNGDEFVVKARVAERVNFHQADLSDSRNMSSVAPADIVFVQNVMCNLQRPKARKLFEVVVSLLKPRAALFADGVDLDMRSSCSLKYALEPLAFAIEQIHEEARIVRGPRYPEYATGLEPFSARRRDATRRYATIFLRQAN